MLQHFGFFFILSIAFSSKYFAIYFIPLSLWEFFFVKMNKSTNFLKNRWMYEYWYNGKKCWYVIGYYNISKYIIYLENTASNWYWVIGLLKRKKKVTAKRLNCHSTNFSNLKIVDSWYFYDNYQFIIMKLCQKYTFSRLNLKKINIKHCLRTFFDMHLSLMCLLAHFNFIKR